MTQDEIIEMAMLEAEFVSHGKTSEEESELFVCTDKDIVRFAKLVAAKAIAELESQEPDYWLGYGSRVYTEKPFKNATALYTHPPQRTEQNFCSRCGKRTADLTTIHTCTSPQENT